MPTCFRPGGKIKELFDSIFGLLNDKSKKKKSQKKPKGKEVKY